MGKEEQPIKKLGKIILLIGILCLMIFAILTLSKWTIIHQYNVKMKEYANNTNYSYKMNQQKEGIETSIQIYAKEGRILAKINEDIVIWKDENTREELYIDNKQKMVLEKANIDDLFVLPPVHTLIADKPWDEMLMSMVSSIEEVSYHEKQCYQITIKGIHLWIDQQTYLPLREDNVSGDGKLNSASQTEYYFGTTTEEQVQKPDLTGYQRKEVR